MPYSPQEVARIKLKSITKELCVLESLPRPTAINYKSFFEVCNERLHPDIPHNQRMIKTVRDSIFAWRKRMSERVLYPKVSKKTMSASTKRDFQDILGYDIDSNPSQVDLERYYHTTGIEVQGSCEMRQKWYQSNMDPRTYYAMGGEAYHKSKNLQSAFNELCEMLEPSSKSLSVMPDRLMLDSDEYAYIYDLSSFSSNLHEQRYFTYYLGMFCVGTRVKVYDTNLGIVYKDLGEMILEYNTLNTNISYSTERFFSEPILSFSGTAGLLGVYGNISTAKFLHACVILQQVQHQNKLNVAGDDGIAAVNNDISIYRSICLLGEMETTKAYRTYEKGCICLKRPIEQFGDHLIMGTLVNWPSFEFSLNDKSVDIRFPSILQMSKNDRKDATASSVTNFLKQLKNVSQLDSALIDRYISTLYQHMHLPKCGNIPQINGSKLGFVPAVEGNYIGRDPISYTIDRLYQGIAVIPVREKKPYTNEMYGDLEFTCNANRKLSILEKLGYLSNEKIQRVISGEDGLQQLKDEYLMYEPILYRYTVVTQIPQHLV
jgi:hypothetical protein